MGTATAPMVIALHFASVRILAASRDDRGRAEWPLHPARLFHALVAVLHELPEDAPLFPAGEAALRWLEALPPPTVLASAATPIPPLTAYVPVNDAPHAPGAPAHRKPRLMPGVVAAQPVLRYAWWVEAAALDRHRPALHGLLARLTWFGRSTNLVLPQLLELAPEQLPGAAALRGWHPDPAGHHLLRVAQPGRLAQLRARHAEGRAPDRGPQAFYRCDDDPRPPPDTVPGPWSPVWASFVLRAEARIPLTAAEPFAKAVRRLLVERARAAQASAGVAGLPLFAVDAFLSGHARDGAPAREARLALLPLGDVGHRHARGHLLGLAVLLPRAAAPERWAELAELLYGDALPPALRLEAERCALLPAGDDAPAGLGINRHAGPARDWVTATPILLSRRPDPGRNRSGQATDDALHALLRRECALSGLPEPEAVAASAAGLLPGVAPARAFQQLRGGPQRWAVHARLRFAAPLAGPLLVGAGRFNGLGLLRPWPSEAA